MEITTTFDGDLRVSAHCDGYTITTDQPAKDGGNGTAPDPFTIFLSGIVTCAGYYALKFCQTRDLSLEGIEIKLTNDFNSEKKRVENINISIHLPDTFPRKYHKALLKSVDQCTVKRTMLFGPSIDVNIA